MEESNVSFPAQFQAFYTQLNAELFRLVESNSRLKLCGNNVAIFFGQLLRSFLVAFAFMNKQTEEEIVKSLLQIDGVTLSSTVPSERTPSTLCAWDQRNIATWWCSSCKQSYCSLCNTVLHSNPQYSSHKYLPLKISQPDGSRETCRCGQGASKSKNTSCSTNRCPCRKSNQKCHGCSCLQCHNV